MSYRFIVTLPDELRSYMDASVVPAAQIVRTALATHFNLDPHTFTPKQSAVEHTAQVKAAAQVGAINARAELKASLPPKPKKPKKSWTQAQLVANFIATSHTQAAAPLYTREEWDALDFDDEELHPHPY